MSILLLLVTAIIILFAGNLISILGPGLAPEVKNLAILQLRIMAPMALLAGLIGIGFGTLNAANSYLLPSISPLFSSLVIAFGVGLVFWQLGEQINTPQYFQLGAIVLAGATLGGAILQWLTQLIVQWRAGMGTLKLRFNLNTPGVMEVFKVMIPATLSSGMLYVNLNVDQFFVSDIPGAAAGLQNATFYFYYTFGDYFQCHTRTFLSSLFPFSCSRKLAGIKSKNTSGTISRCANHAPLYRYLYVTCFTYYQASV